jgi:hypothetical protein
MHQIYVALLDEGVDVWRPVQAEDLGNGVFRLVGPIPEGEVWAFQPGDTIRCSEKLFADGRKGMVATALVNADA